MDFTRTLLTFRFVIASMRSMVFKCLDNFLCFSLSSRTSHYENTQCYFSVGLPRTVCAFVSLTLDNILQQYVPQNTVAKWSKSLDLTTIPEARRILLVVSHFNLSVLATETLSVSLCREIDHVFGAVRTRFDHVLSKGAFLWDDLDQDQWSEITQIMVEQMNWWIVVQSGFIGSFDQPWSEWSGITDPDLDHPTLSFQLFRGSVF